MTNNKQRKQLLPLVEEVRRLNTAHLAAEERCRQMATIVEACRNRRSEGDGQMAGLEAELRAERVESILREGKVPQISQERIAELATARQHAAQAAIDLDAAEEAMHRAREKADQLKDAIADQQVALLRKVEQLVLEDFETTLAQFVEQTVQPVWLARLLLASRGVQPNFPPEWFERRIKLKEGWGEPGWLIETGRAGPCPSRLTTDDAEQWFEALTHGALEKG